MDKDHSWEAVDAVYGTKYLGNIISWIVFFLLFDKVELGYFYYLAGISFIGTLIALTLPEDNW